MPMHRTAQPPKRIIEPIFAIPEGLNDLAHPDLPREEDLWFDVDEDDSDDPEAPVTHPAKKKKKKRRAKPKGKRKQRHRRRRKRNRKDDHKGDRGPNTPKDLKIVRQIMRTKADGSQLVDLVVEVDRIARADKYEFRVTKKDTGKTTIVGG